MITLLDALRLARFLVLLSLLGAVANFVINYEYLYDSISFFVVIIGLAIGYILVSFVITRQGK